MDFRNGPIHLNYNALNLDIPALGELFELNYQKWRNPNYENVASLTRHQVEYDKDFNTLLVKVCGLDTSLTSIARLEKVWLVKTQHKDTHPTTLPFIPHVDYRRYLKVMLYVDKVTSEHGPFSAVAQDPEQYEMLRRSLPPDYKSSMLNRVDVPFEQFTAYTGEAGDIIFFDTNIPHFAGQVRPGLTRRVLRFDFTYLENE
ncbi:phytanoyl-CoA dioxygenase family protein [Bowmanella dokdonensis]|uniref:Phytanoyl-CoA dioxygenase family protein n=1 Tax=Bowmanella dokdonensis TaxID=751969 RepID=A0A939ISB9_9ALTE|nr:phytanoyl-CoA dioxygenase family protein [Bowmanella dokdonensis]MBN7827024.1 phytanoyl-CoA dioxygenase family protein [Bowmanella dokdonensis]